MSFFKKAMANVLGIGGTKVDTVLSRDTITQGEKMDGVINIYGGEIEQEIKNVYICVNTKYEKEVDDKKVNMVDTIQKFEIDINTIVKPKEEIAIPFSFNLDMNCPISKGSSKIWISTILDIKSAVDDSDGDGIVVLPNKYTNTVLEAFNALGFKTKSIKNIYDKRRISKNKFVQEFEYMPTFGDFRSRLDELEVSFVFTSNEVKLLIEVDRRVRGLGSLISESLDLDESNIWVKFSYDELSNNELVLNRLRDSIRRYC